jgi:hypothetical protein
MLRASACLISVLAAAGSLGIPAYGQAVISARSGVVHYFEGSVNVAGQPLQAQLGRFAGIPQGAELQTGQGRAEVLLTPGVLLRVGEKSTIRMIANALSDTRVELVAGSAIVDSSEPGPGTSVTLVYKSWSVHQAERGLYRLDSEPARLQVLDGKLDVWATDGGVPLAVEKGMDLPFASVLVPQKAEGETHDTLSDWSDGRSESVFADNAVAANIQDPGTMPDPLLNPDAFTYFPMLGYYSSPYGLSPYNSGVYGALSPYQSGLYSIYLPGYSHRSLLLGLPGTLPRPIRLPSLPTLPVHPTRTTPLSRPVYSPAPILHPSPAPSLPHGGVRVGGHR